VPIVLKSESLNLLETSGPVQACNGIGLPFLLNVEVIKSKRRKTKEYAACIKIRNAYKILFGDPKGRGNLRGTNKGVEIILKWHLSYI